MVSLIVGNPQQKKISRLLEFKLKVSWMDLRSFKHQTWGNIKYDDF
jgi:hypothetical protein